MSNENEKSYLNQITGESPADRKKRLGRLSQQRYTEKQRMLDKESYTQKQTQYKRISRAKIANTVAKTPEDRLMVSRLPKPSVDKITETLDDLHEYIKTATIRELPKIKAIIENLPDDIEFVKSKSNWSDLTRLIKDPEAELTKQDPTRKKIPSNKTIN